MKYYIYRLDQKRNKFGNPYYGMTDNLKRRTAKWRRVLNDPSIELIILEEHDDEDYCWEREQDVYRVPNGWKRERNNRKKHKKMSIRGGEANDTRSEIATETNSRPEVIEANRNAQCHFYKIRVCDGRWFIVNGSYEAKRILEKMGYTINHMTIHNYAKMNATLEVKKPYTGGKKSNHPKGSINILIIPSTLEEYKQYKDC